DAASISGRDVAAPVVVGCVSPSEESVAPTTTTLPRTAAGGDRVCSTSTKLRGAIVPGGAGESVRADARPGRASVRPANLSAAAIGNVVSRLTTNGIWRTRPSPSCCSVVLDGVARLYLSPSAPPKMPVEPSEETWLVPSTTRG